LRAFFNGIGFFESHVHTNFSDGTNYRLVIQTAIKRGTNVLAITDHNTTRGYVHARSYTKKYCKKTGKDLLIIPAQETETDKGDVLIYGLEETIPKKTDLETTIDLAHEQGAVVVLAHPHNLLLTYLMLKMIRNYKFDGVETFSFLYPNIINRRIHSLMIQFPHLFKLIGEDAHFWWEVGWYHNILELQDLDIDSVIKALKQNKIKYRRKNMPWPYNIKFIVNAYHVGPYSNAGFGNLLKVVMKLDRRKKINEMK